MDQPRGSLLVVCVIFISTRMMLGVRVKEFHIAICSEKDFKPMCNASSYISIKSAWYGRRKRGCVDSIMQQCGCDATADLRNHCDDRRNCTVAVLDKHLHCNSDCSHDWTQHLYVIYECKEKRGLVFHADLPTVAENIELEHEDIHVEVCSEHEYRPKCSSSYSIYISHAWYGRRQGVCVENVRQRCGCDATEDLRNHCAGRRNCRVPVLDKHLHCKSNCSRDFTQHLYIAYGCTGIDLHTNGGQSAVVQRIESRLNWIIIGSICTTLIFLLILIIVGLCVAKRRTIC